MDNDEPAWILSAYHGSDETRDPFEKRKSAALAARRLVRGPEAFPKSVDHWPGAKMSLRGVPGAQCGEPQAEPSDDTPLPAPEMVEFASRPAAVKKGRPSRVVVLPQPLKLASRRSSWPVSRRT